MGYELLDPHGVKQIKLSLEITVDEGLKILELLKQLRTPPPLKTTIDKWPYPCWNCGTKIETPPTPDDKGIMTCPSCGVQIPEI